MFVDDLDNNADFIVRGIREVYDTVAILGMWDPDLSNCRLEPSELENASIIKEPIRGVVESPKGPSTQIRNTNRPPNTMYLGPLDPLGYCWGSLGTHELPTKSLPLETGAADAQTALATCSAPGRRYGTRAKADIGSPETLKQRDPNLASIV